MIADHDLTEAFLAGTLERFSHEDHVRVAWYLLGAHPFDEAQRQMSDGLQRFASAAGVPDKYDATLTAEWMQRIYAQRRALPPGHTWATFSAAAPDLLDPPA